MPIPHIVEQLDSLRAHSHIGKHKHFSAAERCRSLNVLYGVPIVLINVGLGSLMFIEISAAVPEFAKWIGAFIALIAAALGAVQTFFNYQKRSEGHRAIGNRYIFVEREVERLIAMYFDGLVNTQHLSEELNRMTKTYNEINLEGESFPTSSGDYEVGLAAIKRKNEIEPPLLLRKQLEIQS